MGHGSLADMFISCLACTYWRCDTVALKVRRSITMQWKLQMSSTRSETDVAQKADMVKKEGSAERLWKSRLVTIIKTGPRFSACTAFLLQLMLVSSVHSVYLCFCSLRCG